MPIAQTLGQFVIEHGTRQHLATGQILFRQGDSSQTVYACVEGRINLSLTAPSGRELMIATVTAGSAFGELAALDGAPRSATATPATATVLAQLPGDRFLAGISRDPELALDVLRLMADHMRRTTERVAARSTENTTGRVAHLLIELAARFGRFEPAARPIALPITHDELAMWVGSTREAASRSLAQLRATGTVTSGRGTITVVDLAALQAHARTIAT
jgi:CRP/FNR family transcriptional regulator, cyclic AMP receptor protein